MTEAEALRQAKVAHGPIGDRDSHALFSTAFLAGALWASTRRACPCGFRESRVVCADCGHVLAGRAEEEGPDYEGELLSKGGS